MSKLSVYSFQVSAYLDQLERLNNILSKAELERVNRFVREKDAQSYVVSHALLREILSHQLGCKPSDLVFAKNAHGKPLLLDSGIYFNLSHSGDYVLIAISPESPVGIDVEQHRHERNVLEIAERYFTPEECLCIKKQDDQKMTAYFYDIWSTKEAYVKALGQGIAYGFDRFSVVNAEGDFVSSIQGLLLTRLSIGEGYSAAVVGSTRNISICSVHE